MTAIFCYRFEVASIQQYIFAGSRLRELVGGSALIDSLTDRQFVEHVLSKCGSQPIHFARCSGGAITAFGAQPELQQFMRVWPIIVNQRAPGLSFHQGLGAGNSEIEADANARRQLQQDKSRGRPTMPSPNAVILRAARTGEAAYRQKPDEAQSLSTQKKTDRTGPNGVRLADTVGNSFLGDNPQYIWPSKLSPTEKGGGQVMPYLSSAEEDNQDIAVIHIDGNGLGQFFIQLLQRLKKQEAQTTSGIHQQLLFVSTQLDTALKEAANDTFNKVLKPAADRTKLTTSSEEHTDSEQYVIPARPLVLAGDDISLITRADLALETCLHFIERFEHFMACALTTIREQLSEEGNNSSWEDLPRLSACAGIAFVKATHPFHHAYKIAEELTGRAKEDAKAAAREHGMSTTPSAVNFADVSQHYHRETEPELPNSLGTYLADYRQAESDTGVKEQAGAGESNRENLISGLPSVTTLLKLADTFHKHRGRSGKILQDLAAATPADKDRLKHQWLKRCERDSTQDLTKDINVQLSALYRPLYSPQADTAGLWTINQKGQTASAFADLALLVARKPGSTDKTDSTRSSNP